MVLLKAGKNNWKYILIIFLLSVFVGGGILWRVKTQEISLIEVAPITKLEKPPQIESKSPVIYSQEEIWENRVSLENKQVTVEGIIGSSVDCTKGPPPNTCDGVFKFQGTYPNRLDIIGTYTGKTIGCSGTDINLICYPFEEGKKYRITATLKKESYPLGDYYFLELQDFTAAN